MTDFRDLSLQGLWKNNPALVQLLGLCPLLAVTATFINGLGLGLATMLVLIGSNVTVSLVRNVVRNENPHSRFCYDHCCVRYHCSAINECIHL